MAELPRFPFDEAVAALKRRGIHLQPSDHWAEVWQTQHQTAFTVARSAGFDILKDVHDGLLKALEQGKTFSDFKRDLIPLLQKKGWWGRTTVTDPASGEEKTVQLGSLRRLRTIFDVNMRVSYSQGHWEQQTAVKDAFPYLRYMGILDSRIRPRHRRWHGIILPLDHPWWQTHYPPNGWRCRCDAVSVSEDDLQRNGWSLSTAPEDELTPWRNQAGDWTMVPAGIDPGWDYHPGNTDQAAHAARLAMDKLINLPPALGAAAVTELAFSFPQVERELGDWLEGIAAALVNDKQARPQGVRRVVGCIDEEVLAWLAVNLGMEPVTAAITIDDRVIMHMMREAKQERGNALELADMRRLPSLLGKPDAVYWDLGLTDKQKRDPSLLYVWMTPNRGAGKLIVRIDWKSKGKDSDGKKQEAKITNTVVSGRLDLDPEYSFQESHGYIRIKGNL